MQAGAFFLERKRGRGKIFFKKSCLKGTFERNINTIVKKTWYTIPDILIETKKRDDIGENRFDFRLDRLDWNPELDRLSKQGYPVYALTAHQQLEAAGAADPAVPVPAMRPLTDPQAAKELKDRVQDTGTEVLSGMEGVLQIAADPQQDTVLNAMMGVAGLLPTVTAIEAGNNVALANKETLVAGGKLVMGLAKQKGIRLTPIDSEHSAIFQCLQGNEAKSVKRLIITASGGPFYGKTREELRGIKKEQALKHPNWSMGAKITIDSSTLMNKGLEFIEAMWLFSMPPERSDIVVHPQSTSTRWWSSGRLGDGPDGRAGHDDSDPVRADLAAPVRVPGQDPRPAELRAADLFAAGHRDLHLPCQLHRGGKARRPVPLRGQRRQRGGGVAVLAG